MRLFINLKLAYKGAMHNAIISNFYNYTYLTLFF